MFTYNGTAVLQFDSPVTGNAGSGVTVTVRGASTPVAGLGGLANIYNFNESAIPNPLTTDSKGNYTFKALNGTYDIILSEGDPTEVILPSQQFVDLTEVSIGVAQEVQTLTDGQTVVTFTSQTTTSAEFHINGQGVDSRLLTSQDINAALTTPTTITLFDSYPGGSIVTLSKNTDAGNTVAGIVIPTVEEEVVLTDGQTVVTFSTLTTEYSEFHINGIGVDSRLLTSDDINHSLTTPSTITLFESYPVGSIVTLAQNSTKGNISVDITNNIIKDLSQAYEFDTLQDAIVSTIVLPVGKVLNLKERSTGNGGGATWDVVLSGSVTENGYNIVQCTGVPTLSLVLRLGAVVDVKQFGVDATGVVSCSAIVVIAQTVARANNSALYFPAGTYKGNFEFDANCHIICDGPENTIFTQDLSTAPCVKLAEYTGGDGGFNISFGNCSINGGVSGVGLHTGKTTSTGFSTSKIDSIYINGFDTGVYMQSALVSTISGVWARGATSYALHIPSVANVTTMTFDSCRFYGSGNGVYMQAGILITFLSTSFESNTEYGIRIQTEATSGPSVVNFQSCWVEDNATGGVYIDQESGIYATKLQSLEFNGCTIASPTGVPSIKADRASLVYFNNCVIYKLDEITYRTTDNEVSVYFNNVTDNVQLKPTAAMYSGLQALTYTDSNTKTYGFHYTIKADGNRLHSNYLTGTEGVLLLTATDATLDVNGISKVFVDTTAGDVTVTKLENAAYGTVITLINYVGGNNLIINHSGGSEAILLISGAAKTLATRRGIQLIRTPTAWMEVVIA